VLERMKAFEADVPHPEVVWADHVPISPVPPVPAVAPAVPLPPAPAPAGEPVTSLPVAAGSPNGDGPADERPRDDGSPDAVDMASWTDAVWDAWLTRKQSETGP
jgi:hypothetical protein